MVDRGWREARAIVVITVMLGSAEVRGDAVYLAGADGRETAITDVRISGVSEGRIAFADNKTGRQAQRELARVARIELDEEPGLGAAEMAYGQQRWAEAAGGYRKVLDVTRRVWVRAWVAPRLIEAAENSRDVGAAVAGYVALVQTNPGRAGNYTPVLSDEKSEALASAVKDVSAALAEPGITGQQRACLTSFLLDIHRARKDQKSADAILDEMLKGGDAAAARAVVRRKLDGISRLLEGKQFKEAVEQISRDRQIYVEPRDQAEALYYLAEAGSGMAAGAGGDDAAAWKDAALAYMRVVDHFKDAPGTPFVAASLLKTASINERLNNPAAARKLDEQVAAQFTGTPAAASARSSLARMGGK